MKSQEEISESEFEQEVKRIAANLWPDNNGGSIMVDGQERDGVYETEDIIHLIECTVSKRKDKAEKDVGKLVALESKFRRLHRDKGIKCWFITKFEPTADQRTVAQRHNVTAFSFERFQSKIVDANLYRTCRANYAFGSIRNPETGEIRYQGDYIDIDLIDFRSEKKVWGLDQIVEHLFKGNNILIQGHYGVGKSMALKQVYRKIVRKYDAKEIIEFPIYLNLRDHHGQTSPVEALERHARNVGFKNPDHLVRAWRSGFALLILDGYDEIAAFGWAGKTSTLKEVRYKSMELLREFIRQSPRQMGLLIAGRINYFDSLKECENALVVSPATTILKIGDFTQHQAIEYLRKKNISIPIPDWMPTRPLLLGYLVAKGILENLVHQSVVDTPSEGWDYLLNEICKRESAIEAGLSHETVREIIEGIACHCRQFQSGLGPIFKTDLERIFQQKCGYHPDDRALVLLQRLPGLAPQEEQDGSRYFIDHLFASAAKAGDVAKYISNPFETCLPADPRKWQDTLDDLGIQLVALKVEALDHGLIEEALVHAKKNDAEVLSTDVLMCLNYLGRSWKRENIRFQNVLIPTFEIKREVDLSRITFDEVIFREIWVEELPNIATSPTFRNCIIGKMVGCSDAATLPPELFETSTIECFEEQETTTRALLSLDMPTGVKVGLTILKKLFLQSGSGRQENSFHRGLSTNEQSYISQVLELLKSQNIALPSKRSSTNKIWQPAKSQQSRIRKILIDKAYKDPLIERLKLM